MRIVHIVLSRLNTEPPWQRQVEVKIEIEKDNEILLILNLDLSLNLEFGLNHFIFPLQAKPLLSPRD